MLEEYARFNAMKSLNLTTIHKCGNKEKSNCRCTVKYKIIGIQYRHRSQVTTKIMKKLH